MVKKIMFVVGMMMAAGVFAALPDGGPYKEAVGGIEWTFFVANGMSIVESGEEERSAISDSTIGEIEIPSVLGGCPVTRLGDSAFYDCGDLTSVTIPSSVTSIGQYAFCYCWKLRPLTIPKSVASVGGGTFWQCGTGIQVYRGGVLRALV